jgi:hypothetical protein
MAPLILSQPSSLTVTPGQTAVFRVAAAAVPEAQYQWHKNNKPIEGATQASLTINNAGAKDAAIYYATAANSSGRVSSAKASLHIKPAP